ncbi:hypothetical protein A2U01_0083611, partial [Trifolium medium]|nr:hypothetical protein [Trifolium medium]
MDSQTVEGAAANLVDLESVNVEGDDETPE